MFHDATVWTPKVSITIKPFLEASNSNRQIAFSIYSYEENNKREKGGGPFCPISFQSVSSSLSHCFSCYSKMKIGPAIYSFKISESPHFSIQQKMRFDRLTYKMFSGAGHIGQHVEHRQTVLCTLKAQVHHSLQHDSQSTARSDSHASIRFENTVSHSTKCSP